MSKAISEEAEFLVKYTELMVSVWRDEAAERALLADPKQFAIAAGLPVGAGESVVLDRSQADGLFTKEQLLDDWNSAASRHILHVPSAPLVDLSELDERELESISGGVASVNIIVACVVNV
jgi:hypothetical protein